MPNCVADQIAPNLKEFPLELFSLLPVYKNKCYIPDIDITRTEVVCYDITATTEVQCCESAYVLVIRCQLGTNNTKSNDIPYISKCERAYWQHNDISSNDCSVVCGVIDQYEPPTTPLLYIGIETNIISAPWHVAIFSNDTGSFEQICGGSIIHLNLVISAAHCFYDDAYRKLRDKSNYLVGAGKRYRNYDAHEQAAHFNGVYDIRIPLTYQSQPTRDDIAILILDHHFKFTSHIKPVCLEWFTPTIFSSTPEMWSGVVGRTFGWGSTTRTQGPSSGLLTIDLVTKDNEECKKLVNPNLRSEISNEKFCATNSDHATACRGDSGGGFVIHKEFGDTGYYYLAGIISEGLDVKNYCSSGFLSLFVNIQFHQAFIKLKIDDIRFFDSLDISQRARSAYKFKFSKNSSDFV